MNNSFQNLTTTQLGEAAEKMLINEFILGKGFQPFIPSFNGSHYIDCAAMSSTGVTFYMDCKAKSRRMYYADTGIDLADYNHYMEMNAPTYILFADLVQGTVYGGWLQKFSTKIEKNIIYFPLSEMIPYRNLTDIEKATLKQYEQSKYYK